MASGDTLLIFHPYNNEPPSSAYATLDYRNLHPVLDFDPATDESAVFSAVMPQHYEAGGVAVYLHFSAATASAGSIVWNSAFERIGEGIQDVDSDGFATAQSVDSDTSVTSGEVTVASLTHTDGTQMDEVAVGELFRIKITRDANNGTDIMDGDAELHAVEIRES